VTHTVVRMRASVWQYLRQFTAGCVSSDHHSPHTAADHDLSLRRRWAVYQHPLSTNHSAFPWVESCRFLPSFRTKNCFLFRLRCRVYGYHMHWPIMRHFGQCMAYPYVFWEFVYRPAVVVGWARMYSILKSVSLLLYSAANPSFVSTLTTIRRMRSCAQLHNLTRLYWQRRSETSFASCMHGRPRADRLDGSTQPQGSSFPGVAKRRRRYTRRLPEQIKHQSRIRLIVHINYCSYYWSASDLTSERPEKSSLLAKFRPVITVAVPEADAQWWFDGAGAQVRHLKTRCQAVARIADRTAKSCRGRVT